MKKGQLTGLLVVLVILSGCGRKENISNRTETDTVSSQTVTEIDTERISERNAKIQAAAEAWAEAFCSRDGQALYDLFDPERREEFYGMEIVQSTPEDSYIAIGWSSPWAMDHLYTIETNGEQTIFTYYPMTSNPHRWVWKQKVSWKQVDGSWYGYEEEFVQYEQIVAAAEFTEAYSGGIAGTPMDYRTDSEGWEAALEELAQSEEVYRRLLTTPDRAAEYLLNLHGGVGEVIQQGDKEASVIYRFADESQAALIMKQSENGEIWLPEDIIENGVYKQLTADQESIQQLEKLSSSPEASKKKAELAENVEETEVYDAYTKMIDNVRTYLADKAPEGLINDHSFSIALLTCKDYGIPGYLIEDIDGNGTDELIFGVTGINPELSSTWDGVIYDIYTMSDGELVHVLNGWERNRYYFCENGMIANEGSSGAADSNYAYFTFEASNLHLVEAVIYDGMRDADHPWFYSTESEYDSENASPISEEQAEEIMEKYVYECPKFVPFTDRN